MTSALQDDFKNEMFTVKDQQEIDPPPPPPAFRMSVCIITNHEEFYLVNFIFRTF